QAVKQLQAQGVSLHGIARTLVMSPNTVRRYVRANTFPERACYRRGSRLDAYLPYLHARWVQGIHNPTVLWQEIHAQGYPGTARMIERYIMRLYQRLQGEFAKFFGAMLTLYRRRTGRHPEGKILLRLPSAASPLKRSLLPSLPVWFREGMFASADIS